MHTINALFFLVSLLAWNACWFPSPVAGDPAPSTSMIVNETISIPISTQTPPIPIQVIALQSINTHRAFYFTKETQSRMIEVSLPPGGEMEFSDLTAVTDNSGNPIPISQALQVLPSTAYDPNSNYTSTIYVCGTDAEFNLITVLQYSLTTPPISAVKQSSSLQFVASVTLPSNLGGVDSFLFVDGYLYLSGRTLFDAYLLRIPVNNFTRQYMEDVQPILTSVGSFLVATADSTYVYYGVRSGSGDQVYRVTLADFVLDNDSLPLTGVSATFGGAFTDTDRNFIYFYTADLSAPTNLVRVDTVSFTQPAPPLTFGVTQYNARAVVHDAYGGHVYFAHFSTPGFITDVNLETFLVSSDLRLDTPFLETALLDSANSLAYFTLTAASNLTVLKVQLPLPCANASFSFAGNNCSYPNGYCEYATCHCFSDADYEGPACDSLKCLHDCYRDAANNTDGQSHGTCNNGTCSCAADFTGADCSLRRCKNDCLGRGSCTSSFTCQCGPGWYGEDCSSLVGPCDELHSCHDCATNSSCGWCEDRKVCLDGDTFGPLFELCERYSYQTCPTLFFYIFGYILTVVCWLFMIASAIVTIVQDFTLPDNTKTKRFVLRFWWRNQLAAKTWQFVEYIQMLAITGYLAVDMPALYSEFILPSQWSILHLPYPFPHPPVIRPPSRDLLTFFEEGRVVHSEAHELFLANLFYYALAIVAPLFIFAIPAYIVALCMRDFSEKEKLIRMSKSRLLYCFIRLTQFAYFPLIVTSLFTLTWYSSAPDHSGNFKAAVVLSVFTLIGIGIVFPVMTFFKIHNKDKELFSFDFSQKYGSLYQKYHFRKGFFNTIQIGKLLLISIWIALLYRHPVPQLILIALTHFVYFFVLLVMKPNAEHIHYFTELVVTALSGLFFLFILGFRDRTTAERWGLAVVVVHILAVVVLVAGLISTVLKMNGILGVTDLKHTISTSSSSSSRNSIAEQTAGLQQDHHQAEASSDLVSST